MSRGYIAIHRGFFEHPIFAPEPFTEREAFQWLIMEAAWTERRIRRGRTVIVLARGQLAHSLRYMATAWRWKSDARVRRFLNRLKNDAMVTIETTQDATRITICNYDKYNQPRSGERRADDAPTDAPATHRRRKEEELNNLTTEPEDCSLRSQCSNASDDAATEPELFDPPERESEPEPVSWPREAWDRFWRQYPHKVGKRAAVRAFVGARRRCIARGIPFETVMFGLDRYVAEKPPDRAWCNPATWLNQDRWDDEPSNPAKIRNGGGATPRAREPRGADAFGAAFAEIQAELADGIASQSDAASRDDPG